MAAIPHQKIPARDLRDGDLMRCGVGNSYVLVADATEEGGRIVVTIYDGVTPKQEPTYRFEPDKIVSLTGRNLRADQFHRR